VSDRLQLLEIRAGRAKDHERPAWDPTASRVWRSAYDKSPIAGPVRVRALGVEGDEQYDREVHGGVHMAVLAYDSGHYPGWRAELALPEIGPGGFGENLVVSGADESSVCIGDVWRLGTATLQVSQPRGPCANISRRWNREAFLQRVTETARGGWYLRVLEEGVIEAGSTIERIERTHAGWSVERVFRARIDRETPEETLAAIADLEALSPEWRRRFSVRVSGS
jgi:MOSC domain-containing protein YiiM